MLKEHSNYEMAVHASGEKTKDKKTEQKKKNNNKTKRKLNNVLQAATKTFDTFSFHLWRYRVIVTFVRQERNIFSHPALTEAFEAER